MQTDVVKFSQYMERLLSGLFMIGLTGLVEANTINVTGEIMPSSDIDYWTFSLSSSSNVTIDVLAFESGINDDYIDTPQGLDFFGNGADNDGLDSYIYLLDSNNNLIASNDDALSAAALNDGSRTTWWTTYSQITIMGLSVNSKTS